ncbi:LCP family protein [Thalassobacillus hwangdonensis]|uniref:LCP family protein n=1 Tax=Thalassobacillus hwangdonensis TaxID=546108 RepID=A0ABW3L2G5_9BACI
MDNKNNKSRVVRRKKRKLRKRAYFVIVPLVLLLAIGGYAGYLYMKASAEMSDTYVEDNREKSDLREEKVDPSVDNVSILIMGVDSNEHRDNADSALTDSLMLATFNKEDKSVDLTSIPRDSLVYIPEVGYEDKITHAHAFGGPQATVETVENLLNVPVDYYVKLNFHAFVDVVDAIGGVTVDVPYEFKESNSMDKRDAIHLYPGEQKVNGEEALAFARTRKMDNDIQRGKRQQDVLKAIMKKATSASSVFKYDNMIEAVGDNMKTNMSFSEMRSFFSYGTSGKDIEINTYTLEGTDYQPGNTYYWALDQQALEEAKTRIQNHLGISSTMADEGQDVEEAQGS